MEVKRNNKKYFIGIAVAFGLPLFCYLLVTGLSKDTVHPPKYFVADSVAVKVDAHGKKTYDTCYHRVADIRLINQVGESVSLDSDLKGKILVIDFFFVSCPTICPRLTSNMAMLQRAFRKNKAKESSLDTVVQLVSMTVNPLCDSFKRLREYADRYGANSDHWWFLTGDKKQIYDFARNQVFVTAAPGDGGPDDFIHTEKMILVDRNRHIRGYFNGLDSIEVQKIADNIVLLTLEKDGNH
jgi:protein SCO1